VFLKDLEKGGKNREVKRPVIRAAFLGERRNGRKGSEERKKKGGQKTKTDMPGTSRRGGGLKEMVRPKLEEKGKLGRWPLGDEVGLLVSLLKVWTGRITTVLLRAQSCPGNEDLGGLREEKREKSRGTSSF